MGLFDSEPVDARNLPITTEVLETLGFGLTSQSAVKHFGENKYVCLVTVQFLWNNGFRDYPEHLKKEHWVIRKGFFLNEMTYIYTIGGLIDYIDGITNGKYK